jgi:cytochrome c oxidase assembly protein subunit 11
LVNDLTYGKVLRIRSFLVSTPTRQVFEFYFNLIAIFRVASSHSSDRKPKFSSRLGNDGEENRRATSRDTMFYVISLGVIAIGFTFAAIPAYRMFCEATSFGGLTQVCFVQRAFSSGF